MSCTAPRTESPDTTTPMLPAGVNLTSWFTFATPVAAVKNWPVPVLPITPSLAMMAFLFPAMSVTDMIGKGGLLGEGGLLRVRLTPEARTVEAWTVLAWTAPVVIVLALIIFAELVKLSTFG